MLAFAMRAALLDGRIYREIGEEPRAMFRALGTVLAAAVAFGLGLMNADFEGFCGERLPTSWDRGRWADRPRTGCYCGALSLRTLPAS